MVQKPLPYLCGTAGGTGGFKKINNQKKLWKI